MYYLLKDKEPVPCTMEEWADGMTDPNWKRVRSLKIGKLHVSTIFLGLDHSWGDGPPLVFETMIFAGHMDHEYQTRCSTYNQAVKGHWRAIGYLIGSIIQLKLNNL
jgi:hypothetical protein